MMNDVDVGIDDDGVGDVGVDDVGINDVGVVGVDVDWYQVVKNPTGLHNRF